MNNFFPMPKEIILLWNYYKKKNYMWFLATFRMISVLTIPNTFIQISSYEQQYLTEYLVHIFLAVS